MSIVINAGETLVAQDVVTMQRRLVDGELKLVPLLGTADPRLAVSLAKWRVVLADYEAAVTDLTKVGLVEPEL